MMFRNLGNYRADTAYGIGTQPNKIATLRNLGIAVPNQVTYQPSSVVYTRADMSRVGDGFSMANWIWDTISLERLARLLEFLNGSTYAAVYIRTDTRDGTEAIPSNAFKVFSCVMWKPMLAGKEGTPIVNSPYVLQTVNIQFVNLLEQVGYL